MGRTGRLERLAPLTGVLAVALIVAASIVMGGDTPGADASQAKITAFWQAHDDKAMLSSVLLGLGAIPLLWFAGSLRAALRVGEGAPGRLAAVAFGGLVVVAVALTIWANLQFLLGDQVDHLSPDALQAVNAISDEFFFPLIVGFAIFLLATGVAGIRHRALHPALSWTALILGIGTLNPVGYLALTAAAAWIVVAGVVLALRPRVAPAPTAPASSPGSPS
jgi:hypothetical protein